MALGMAMVMLVMMMPEMLGIMCRKMMRRSEAPRVRAAMTYSMFFNCSTWPRTRRAELIQPTQTMATIREPMPGPMTTMSRMARMMVGMP